MAAVIEAQHAEVRGERPEAAAPVEAGGRAEAVEEQDGRRVVARAGDVADAEAPVAGDVDQAVDRGIRCAGGHASSEGSSRRRLEALALPQRTGRRQAVGSRAGGTPRWPRPHSSAASTSSRTRRSASSSCSARRTCAIPIPSLEERRANLDKLERILVDNADAIADAINARLRPPRRRGVDDARALHLRRRHPRHARRSSRKWMKPQRRHVVDPLRDRREPRDPAAEGRRRHRRRRGTTRSSSPISPLTSVLAAGNRAHDQDGVATRRTSAGCSPRSSRAVFPEDIVAILPGVRAQDFSTLPFDHLIFTGSADAGRTVMRAAAENLTPVTLELGGKSPTIICDDFDVERRPSRILYAQVRQRRADLPRARLPVRPRGQARRSSSPPRKRIMPQRYPDTNEPQLHVGDRREVVPPAARDARRRRAARARASCRSSRARRSTTSCARSRRTSSSTSTDDMIDHAGGDLRTAPAGEDLPRRSTRSSRT